MRGLRGYMTDIYFSQPWRLESHQDLADLVSAEDLPPGQTAIFSPCPCLAEGGGASPLKSDGAKTNAHVVTHATVGRLLCAHPGDEALGADRPGLGLL